MQNYDGNSTKLLFNFWRNLKINILLWQIDSRSIYCDSALMPEFCSKWQQGPNNQTHIQIIIKMVAYFKSGVLIVIIDFEKKSLESNLYKSMFKYSGLGLRPFQKWHTNIYFFQFYISTLCSTLNVFMCIHLLNAEPLNTLIDRWRTMKC